MLQFHPQNPFRVVNWRWERARVLRESKSRSVIRRTNDQWILEAFKFQRELAKCADDVDRYELMDEYPDLYGAYVIYQRGDNEDRHPLRYAIEARILADQSYPDIAQKFGTTSRLIESYEQVFFNVKDRLSHEDYIMTCVIGPSVHAGLTDRDYDLLWKLFGYIYGPVALDSFILTANRRFRPEKPDEVNAVLAEDARSSIQRKVAVVSRTYAVNAFSQSELLNIYARMLEMEKEGGEKNRDVILQNVQVMLDKLPFRSGTENIVQPKLLDQFDAGSVELKTEEILAASVGNVDPASQIDIANLKFPEPKKDVKPTK